ncbi:MAG TPA: hypothetical protein VGV59_17000, partial [Pyrinomonadaceae bacterium]|nr:hypothetical protein [Pyrinomonadaceae bacterium]
MSKRRLVVIFAAFVLTIGFTAVWSAEGDEREGDTAANIIAAGEAPTGSEAGEKPKKKGNRFARFFKAPFKAVGRLLDGDDKGKVARLTEKDVERFESVGVVRMEESRGGEKKALSSSA